MKKKMMIMIKIPLMSLAIWLLFLISTLSLSLSHALPDKQLLPAGVIFSESSLEEESLVGLDAIGLRKMGNGRKRVAMKRMRKLEIATNDERQEEDQESSRIISGANHSDTTCNFEDQKGDFGVSRKMGDKNCKKSLNVGGFATFGADYKGPFHHPPKHN